MSRKLPKSQSPKIVAGRVALVDVEIMAQHVCREHLQEVDEGNDEWTYRLDAVAAAEALERRVVECASAVGAESARLACGSLGNFRKRLDPSYKANRPRKPLGYRRVMELVRESFESDSLAWLEADDVMGILATGELEGRCVICSSDKDMRTVPGLHFNFDAPGALVDVVTPEQADLNHLVLALAGDSTDGYKGARGVGEVTARRELEDLGHWARPQRALKMFLEAGHDEEYALLQCRLARVLRQGEYSAGEVTLWTWPTTPRSGRLPARSETLRPPGTGKPTRSGSQTSRTGSRPARAGARRA